MADAAAEAARLHLEDKLPDPDDYQVALSAVRSSVLHSCRAMAKEMGLTDVVKALDCHLDEFHS